MSDAKILGKVDLKVSETANVTYCLRCFKVEPLENLHYCAECQILIEEEKNRAWQTTIIE